MRTFPLPRPKCSFPFPTCLFFPSLALLATAVVPDSSFSPSRYLRLLPCMHPSFLVHLRASVERSQFITVLEFSNIRFQGRRNKVHEAPWSRCTTRESNKLKLIRKGTVKNYRQKCRDTRPIFFSFNYTTLDIPKLRIFFEEKSRTTILSYISSISSYFNFLLS